jgi:hypothetical protein
MCDFAIYLPTLLSILLAFKCLCCCAEHVYVLLCSVCVCVAVQCVYMCCCVEYVLLCSACVCCNVFHVNVAFASIWLGLEADSNKPEDAWEKTRVSRRASA